MTKVKKEIRNRFGDKVCSAGHVTRRELSDFYSQKKKKKKKMKKKKKKRKCGHNFWSDGKLYN